MFPINAVCASSAKLMETELKQYPIHAGVLFCIAHLITRKLQRLTLKEKLIATEIYINSLAMVSCKPSS